MTVNGERPHKPFASWWARDIIEPKSCALSDRAKALLMVLAAYANAAHYCNPSVEKLGRSMGVQERVVQRARAELVAAGLIKFFPGGQGPKATNGYWLAVKGVSPDTLRTSTRVSHQTPINGGVIHKGVSPDAIRVSPQTPEVDSEVSKERARVFSPPLTTKSGRKLLRDGYTDWGSA